MDARNPARHKPQYFEFAAGVLCLDFINTLDDRPRGQPKELINSYLDMVHFGEDTKILDPLQVRNLSNNYTSAPAQRALRQALALREALFAIFSATVNKSPAPPDALNTLNQCLRSAADHSQLVERKKHFSWNFVDSLSHEAVFWPIARSAADLLVSDRLQFVRTCSSKTCQWLFLDTSKNHRRRWCSMKVCGNRVKVRRFYERQKRAEQRSREKTI
jgi:predicted RNA-binding Zn ribbon-like protein